MRPPTATPRVAAFDALPDDVACLILTQAAHAALGPRLAERPGLTWVVVPQ